MSTSNDISITKTYTLYIKNTKSDACWGKILTSTDKKEVMKRFALYAVAKIEISTIVIAKTTKVLKEK